MLSAVVWTMNARCFLGVECCFGKLHGVLYGMVSLSMQMRMYIPVGVRAKRVTKNERKKIQKNI